MSHLPQDVTRAVAVMPVDVWNGVAAQLTCDPAQVLAFPAKRTAEAAGEEDLIPRPHPPITADTP
jgi:hypothetical protein